MSSLVALASGAKALCVREHVRAVMGSGVRACGGWAVHHGQTVAHWVVCHDGGSTDGGTHGGAVMGGATDGGFHGIRPIVGGTPGRGI